MQCSTIDFHETKNSFDICYWYRLTVLCSMRLISNNAEHKQSTDKIAIKSLIQIMSLISLSNICNKGTSGIRLILLWRKFYIISQSFLLKRNSAVFELHLKRLQNVVYLSFATKGMIREITSMDRVMINWVNPLAVGINRWGCADDWDRRPIS